MIRLEVKDTFGQYKRMPGGHACLNHLIHCTRPRKEVTKGATATKIGAAMSEVSRMKGPGIVSPRERTMIPITRVMNRIGAARSHEAKPKKGTSDRRNTRPLRT